MLGRGHHCGYKYVSSKDDSEGLHVGNEAMPPALRVFTPLLGLALIGTMGAGTSVVMAAPAPQVQSGSVASAREFRGLGDASSRDILNDGEPSRSDSRTSVSTVSTGSWGGIEQLNVPYSHSTDEKTALDDLKKNRDAAQALYDSSNGKVDDEQVRTVLKASIDKVDPIENDPNSKLDSINAVNDEVKTNTNAVTASIQAKDKKTADALAALEAARYKVTPGVVNGSADLSTIKLPDGRTGNDLVNYAMQYVGKVPYVWGGTTTSGWDCSGFVRYVYAQFGIALPRVSGAQAGVGRGIGSLADAKPGDIIANAQHAAIYIGGGMVVNALDPADGTTITPVVWAFSSNYSIRRVIE